MWALDSGSNRCAIERHGIEQNEAGGGQSWTRVVLTTFGRDNCWSRTGLVGASLLSVFQCSALRWHVVVWQTSHSQPVFSFGRGKRVVGDPSCEHARRPSLTRCSAHSWVCNVIPSPHFQGQERIQHRARLDDKPTHAFVLWEALLWALRVGIKW